MDQNIKIVRKWQDKKNRKKTRTKKKLAGQERE